MQKFIGIIVALITPFKEDGSVYIDGIKNEIEYLASYGYKNLFICGSYGSFPIMTTEERKLVSKHAVLFGKQCGMKSIVHIGSPSTKIAMDLSKYAEDIGADAISAVVPFYYSRTIYNDKTYLKYFERIINNVSIDVHCYNNPNTTGFNVSVELLKQLMNIGLKGIKDGGNDLERTINILNFIDDDFDYYPSSTSAMVSNFIFGVKSCISGVALTMPGEIMQLYNKLNNTMLNSLDITNSFKLIMKVRSILGQRCGRAISAYDILNYKGIDVGICREPWLSLNKEDSLWLINELKALGVIND